jgi:high-affinity nickel-transport protein
MQEGKRPVSIGLFFSLGHSTLVCALSVGVAFAATALQSHFAAFKSIGAVISTSASALFLLLVAIANIVILVSVFRTFQAVKRGEHMVEHDFDLLLNSRGVLARLFRPLFRMVSRSWHLYLIGFLFGLGFDTATEVALFGISAGQAATGMSFWNIMVFPALFSAGMALVDTTDGILMLGAYGWAFLKPIRKIYYNLTITFMSVVVAILIGGVETLGLLVDRFQLSGGVWDTIGMVNDNFGLLGYGVIGIFVLSWLVSIVIYRLKRYDDIVVSVR